MNVCQVYDSRRYGIGLDDDLLGSAIVTPWLFHVIVEPGSQSVTNSVFQ